MHLGKCINPPPFSPLSPTIPHLRALAMHTAHTYVRTRTRVGLLVLHNFSQGVHFFRKSFFGACVIKKPV